MSDEIIPPGSKIGLFGTGQLGRMLALSAHRMGYEVFVYGPDVSPPAAPVAHRFVQARYEDLARVTAFAGSVDVITLEFENIPISTVEAAERVTRVYPSSHVLSTAQNRLREKNFLKNAGFPVTPFERISSVNELEKAVRVLQLPAILKTSDSGYDGKGQYRVNCLEDAEKAWIENKLDSAVLEQVVPFIKEISVIGARNIHGHSRMFPVFENNHIDHILDTTICPADIDSELADEARELTAEIMEALDVIGLLTVELFVGPNNQLLVNELAPRVHNSGHLTLEACHTSQFEQQIRAVTGLPLGNPRLVSPAAMANLLGDLWSNGTPDWSRALHDDEVKLHLYGKGKPMKRRKMGHLTVLADEALVAREAALNARDRLIMGPQTVD